MDRQLNSRRLLLAALALLGAGCSPEPAPYADAYREALSRYQGIPAVTEAMTDRFVRFFSRSHTGTSPDPADLYAEQPYFSDTLLTTENRGAALSHLQRMHAHTESMQVTLLDRQIDGQDVYLVWQMKVTFEPLTSPVSSNTVGVTHLRFDDAGRIILQQDFWESGEGFYRHLPVLGRLMSAVKARFAESAPA